MIAAYDPLRRSNEELSRSLAQPLPYSTSYHTTGYDLPPPTYTGGPYTSPYDQVSSLCGDARASGCRSLMSVLACYRRLRSSSQLQPLSTASCIVFFVRSPSDVLRTRLGVRATSTSRRAKSRRLSPPPQSAGAPRGRRHAARDEPRQRPRIGEQALPLAALRSFFAFAFFVVCSLISASSTPIASLASVSKLFSSLIFRCLRQPTSVDQASIQTFAAARRRRRRLSLKVCSRLSELTTLASRSYRSGRRRRAAFALKERRLFDGQASVGVIWRCVACG